MVGNLILELKGLNFGQLKLGLGLESEFNKNPKSWIFVEGLGKNGPNLDKLLEGFMWARIGNWIGKDN